MAVNTNNTLKNDVIYSVYVRNYGENGIFKEVEEDLERIKDLVRYYMANAYTSNWS